MLLLAGCDQLGLETPQVVNARKEAEGKAVGAACRHAGRAIEDCYLMNKRADKAAVFAGWREMNDYMRENNIEVVQPKGPPTPPPSDVAEREESGEQDKPAAKKGA